MKQTVIRVYVKTGRGFNKITKQPDGSILIVTQAKPIDGAANKAALQLLADYLGLPKTSLHLKSGSSSHFKTFVLNK